MPLVTTAALAKRWGLTQQAVAYWIREGALKATKLGKTWVIDEKDLEGFQRPTPGRPKKPKLNHG